MASLKALQETSETLSLQVVAGEERAARAESDLRIEREYRESLQVKEVKCREQINSLQYNIKQFQEEGKVGDWIKPYEDNN